MNTWRAIIAVLALAFPVGASSVTELQNDKGEKFIVFSAEGIQQLRAIFLAQRARIEKLETSLENLKAGNGCS